MGEDDGKPKRVEGREFLEQLRLASGLTDFDGPSELTLKRRNSSFPKARRPNLSLSSLSELFEPVIASKDAARLPKKANGDGSQAANGRDITATATTETKKPTSILPPSALRPQPPKIHERAVSWGQDVLPPSQAHHDFSKLQQPVLEKAMSIDENVAEAWLGTNPNRQSRHTGSIRPRSSSIASSGSSRRLNLECVAKATPFEQEAETFLIKAIEQQQNEEEGRRERADTFSSTNLINVSDSAHDFVLDSPQAESAFGENRDDSPAENSVNEVEPLVAPRPLAVHRRSLSVEETLHKLNTAMSAIHDKIQTPEGGKSTRSTSLAHNDVLISAIDKPSRVNRLPTVTESTNVLQDGDLAAKNDRDARETGTNQDPMLGDNDVLGENAGVWKHLFRYKQAAIRSYMKNILVYFVFPATGIAAILFYLAGNPSLGQSSASWWLLFLCVRQVTTLSMAIVTQVLVVDFIALRTRILLYLTGPVVTLVIVQSKGAPFICFWWSIYNLAMLFGSSRFAAHWAYWQDAIELFNDVNPSGGVVSSDWYRQVLTIGCTVSVVAAIKRFLVGLYLGRQTFTHYGKQLTKVMRRMLLVSEVAALPRNVGKTDQVSMKDFLGIPDLPANDSHDDESTTTHQSPRTVESGRLLFDTTARDPMTGNLNSSERMKLRQLLDQWEEPDREFHHQKEHATISAVLSFRKALTFIHQRYPFSYSFGPAQNREECIESSQKVFLRLAKLGNSTFGHISFDTIAQLAMDGTELNSDKVKALMKLFRPNRDGNLTMLDFVKSVDSVYKDFRLLNASIQNASALDSSFESVFDVFFYLVVTSIVLSRLGFDPLSLFLSLSSIILAFAFAIGSSAAKYIEGLLLILVRRPYSIGDRISFASVETEPSNDGSPGWLVQHITLFETTLVFMATNELASVPNGAIANSRIINSARSPQAKLLLSFKIPISTSYSKIMLFKSAIEEYMKTRPREWLSFNGFRANRIEADQGWTEYIVAVQHRQSWQEIGSILDSKANLNSFCQEVLSQLDVDYKAPPLPVDLHYRHSSNVGNNTVDDAPEPSDISDLDSETHAKEFRSMAMSRHNIFLG